MDIQAEFFRIDEYKALRGLDERYSTTPPQLPTMFSTLAKSLLILAPLAGFAAGQTLDTTTHCGQWDTVAIGTAYTLYLDLWGQGGATSGSQCSSVTSVSGTTVAWKTTYNWVRIFLSLDSQSSL